MRRLARCCQRGEKGFEGSGSAQSPEALPDAVPRTEFGGKSAPGDVVNDKILQGFQEVPVVPSLVAAPRARLPKQLHNQTPTRSGSSRTTCRATRPAPSTRLSIRPKPGASCAASSSTTPPSTPAGSTWWRSRSGCCAANASTVESTIQRNSIARSAHGSGNETRPALASIGCSQPTKPAARWVALTPTRPKSHNHCAEVLASL